MLLKNLHIFFLAVLLISSACSKKTAAPIDPLRNGDIIRVMKEESFDAKFALILAAMHGDMEIIKKLAREGKDINGIHPKLKSITVLNIAAERGHKDVVNYMIEKGADVNEKNGSGLTALDFAKEKGHKDIVKLLKKAGAKE